MSNYHIGFSGGDINMVNLKDLLALQRMRGATLRRRRMPIRASVPGVLARAPGTRTYIAGRRAAGSKTATKLLRYRKRKNPMARKLVKGAQGGQASFSQWMAVNRPSPKVKTMKRVAASNFYVTNEAAQLVVNEGFQSIGAWSFQSTADLKSIALNVPGGGAGITPRNFVMESCTGEYLITNSTLATMYIDIYDVVRRRDADLNTSSASQNPATAWKIGVDNESAAPGSSNYKNINSLPTDSTLLKDYFKIVQRSHIGLAQGATHRHRVLLKSNKLLNTNLLDTKETEEDLAGYSVYTMIVAYGQPASIVNEFGTTVTTASGAIDVVKCVRYKYVWVSDTANNFYFTDNLSSLTGEQIVSAGAGQIVPNQFV